MKKGAISLKLLAVLIIAFISLAIGITIIVKFEFLTGLQTLICTSLTTASSWLRGNIVNLLWLFYWVLLGIMALLIVVKGKACKGPYAIVCIATYAGFVAFLSVIITGSFSSIPLVSCVNPLIKIGPTERAPGDSDISKQQLYEVLADKIEDCWKMYGSGIYDPLTGLEPPNPRVCYAIKFNVNEDISMKDFVKFFVTEKHPNSEKKDYYSYIFKEYSGGPLALLNPMFRIKVGNKNSWNTEFAKGIIYILYADDHWWSEWGSSVCDIYDNPHLFFRDRIYLCYIAEGSASGVEHEVVEEKHGVRCIAEIKEFCCLEGSGVVMRMERCISYDDFMKNEACKKAKKSGESEAEVTLADGSKVTINCEDEKLPKDYGLCYKTGDECTKKKWISATCFEDPFCDSTTDWRQIIYPESESEAVQEINYKNIDCIISVDNRSACK